MDPLKIVSQEFWAREGKKLVTGGLHNFFLSFKLLTFTVSADDDIRDAVRILVQERMSDPVDIIDLDFQPPVMNKGGIFRAKAAEASTV